ncbi:hypothetical protein ONS95_005410 [Cadophora gregata]|uniref:uncharacterized protein n=1 Tax=Cadophora gregata TaxID=51156 RepID=UPI0026DC45E3|nr:uncharacterized protein ONS95_005410 [Cadophora gregata]KAK0103384.1 hypothetical protein ONS95_005410 [Cadophora gregata]KAK0107575.1 hypothetical protein ONS96_003381 [Cadophora gregata f. sp. sojae]
MQNHPYDTGRKFYNPFSTRAPVLILLLLCTLGLIALSEVAVRRLPAHDGVGRLGKVADQLNQTLNINIGRNLKRQEWTTLESTDIILDAIPSATVTPVENGIDSSHTGTSSSQEPPRPTVTDGQLGLGDGSLPTPPPDPVPELEPTPNPEPFVGGGNTNPSPSGPGVAPTGQLDTGGPSILPPDAGNGNSPPAPTPPPILVIADGQTSTITPAPTPGASDVAPTSEPGIAVVDGISSSLSAGQIVTDSNGASIGVLTEVNGQTFTVVGVISPTMSGMVRTSATASTTKAAVVPVSTFVNGTGTYLKWSNGGVTFAPRITLVQYICVAIVPLLLAVIFTIPWRILDSTIRELEPFYQLAGPGGAFAEDSLCLNYGASFLITMPFKSITKGHFIVCWSSLISIAALFLAPLASEAFFVSLTGTCGANIPSQLCHGAWGVYPSLVRAIQGILAFIAVLLVLLIAFNFKRSSGVYSEPLSIIGLASLLYKSHVLQDFREIDSLVKNRELKSILSGRRYALSDFTSNDHKRCYGLVNVNTDVETGFTAKATRSVNRGRYKLVIGSKSNVEVAAEEANNHSARSKGAKFWWVVTEKLYYIAAFMLLGGLLALISYYHWTSADTAFERFMNSQDFGVRFMMTALGVAVKLFWSGIDQDLRKLAPFQRLLHGSSHPNDSVLVPIWTSPFAAIIPSLRRGHFFVALICFVSVLSEFLPICLANISFSPAITKKTYEVCNFISMGVLILMVGCILFLIGRPMRGRPLPRSPATVASVGVYLAGKESEWVGDGHGGLMDGLEGASLMKRWERDEFIREKGVLYAMGVVHGDGLRIDDDRRIQRLWAD